MSLKNLRHYEAKSMVFSKVIWRLSKSDSLFDAKMEFQKKCFVLYVFYEGLFLGAKSDGGYVKMKQPPCAA